MPVHARIPICLLLSTLALPLPAALPELSSIEPIEVDEATQRFVARGDARFAVDNALLRADRISYYQAYGLADATGEVSVTSGQYHVSGDNLSYDVENQVFSIEQFRSGLWPFYVAGERAGGAAEAIEVTDATLYYGEPGPFTPNVSAQQINYVQDESVSVRKSTFRVGSVPLMYLPGYRQPIGQSLPEIWANAGASGSRGVFFQSRVLFPVSDGLRLGANLDGYTQRGVLVGPAAQYLFDSRYQTMRGALSSGYIADQDTIGNDANGNPIDSDRYFVEWRHKQHLGERVTLTGVASLWSDSEITRDFREDYFDNNQQPDTFLEGSYSGDNYVLSAFGRVRPNDFQNVVTRTPELRFDLLPVPVFNTGIYQRFAASIVRLEERFANVVDPVPLMLSDSTSDRLDAIYSAERPLHLTDWFTVTPLASGRVTHYANGSIDPANPTLEPGYSGDDYTRGLYELGVDFEMRAQSTYPTRNRVWAIDGLRHVVRPIANYRYLSNPDDLGQVPRIDRTTFDLNRSLVNQTDIRDIDSIEQTHYTRLGLENLYQTRADDYGSRTLAELNFYQDVLFDKNTRYDGSQEETLNASWIEFILNPAPWVTFDLATRFRTENMMMENIRSRLTLRSGEIWQLSFSSDTLRNQFDQYRVAFRYRLNERRTLLYDIGYDSDTGTVYRQAFGLRNNLHRNWDILYLLTFRDGDQREDEISFNIQLQLVGP